MQKKGEFPNLNKVATIKNIVAHQGSNHHETEESLATSICDEETLIKKAKEYNAVLVYKSPHTKKPGHS